VVALSKLVYIVTAPGVTPWVGNNEAEARGIARFVHNNGAWDITIHEFKATGKSIMPDLSDLKKQVAPIKTGVVNKGLSKSPKKKGK